MRYTRFRPGLEVLEASKVPACMVVEEAGYSFIALDEVKRQPAEGFIRATSMNNLVDVASDTAKALRSPIIDIIHQKCLVTPVATIGWCWIYTKNHSKTP